MFAVLVTDTFGDCRALIVVVITLEVYELALTVAWLVIEPLSRSDCVIVYVPVQVVDAPGGSVLSALEQLKLLVRLSAMVYGGVMLVVPVFWKV